MDTFLDASGENPHHHCVVGIIVSAQTNPGFADTAHRVWFGRFRPQKASYRMRQTKFLDSQ
jgi:hypothetical protein